MQASWGAENGAPRPARGGLLFGEEGRWKVSMECSVPDVFTWADKEVRGGDDPDVKFNKKIWNGPKGGVQGQSTKKPAEMDILAAGVTAAKTFSAPDTMTMNDHDHGEVWPPPMSQKPTPFLQQLRAETESVRKKAKEESRRASEAAASEAAAAVSVAAEATMRVVVAEWRRMEQVGRALRLVVLGRGSRARCRPAGRR